MPELETIYQFRHMLIAGPLIGATCALLSVYIVLRRMALISEGVAHGGFGGMAMAIVLGYYMTFLDNNYWRTIITAIFCVITSLLVGWVSRRKRVSEDSAIGIFLTTSIAFGAILIAYRAGLPIKRDAAGNQLSRIPLDLESLLFGQFVDIIREDTILLAGVAVVVFGVIFALYHQFLYTTLDEEMARVNGVNTRLINTLLLILISLVTCICVRLVGAFMITALMIIPGATANMLSRRFAGVLVFSLLIGTLGTFTAAYAALVSPFNKYPPGPIVVLVLFTVFAAVWAFRHFIKPKALPPSDAPPPTEAHAHPPGAFGHGHAH